MFKKLTKNLKRELTFKSSEKKMREKSNSFEGFDKILVVIVALSFFLFLFQNVTLTGFATETSTSSTVSIEKYLAINFGTNLSGGIEFGNVATLPATNVNASHNYDGTANATTYSLDVSTDSNNNVDFCTKANTGLTDPALDVIGLGNETYAAANSTNISIPALSNETSFTTGYVKAQNVTTPGNSSYWRFWLDIPAAQPSGNYNNTVYFKGVVSGLSC